MRTFVLPLILLAVSARAAEPKRLEVRACIKWSRDIPDAQKEGAGLFSAVTRVEGKGPFPDCDVVIETESFGVGWLMSAYMKEGVMSPCGKRLGGFSFRYKGDQWQTKMIAGLHEFLTKHPEALTAAKDCSGVPSAGTP